MTLWQKLRRWREDRLNINILNAMSARELNDIGLTRSEIRYRVRQQG